MENTFRHKISEIRKCEISDRTNHRHKHLSLDFHGTVTYNENIKYNADFNSRSKESKTPVDSKPF